MPRFDTAHRAPPAEAELYYIHVPGESRPVAHKVEFLSLSDVLDDERICRGIWEVITAQFKTRSKFLSIWPSVRFVATHHRGGELAGFLLVSSPVNWQIDYVVVRPEFRGQGIAEALVNATVNEALDRHVPYVMLTSREGLRPLYESACGFTVVATKGDGPLVAPDREPVALKVSC